MCGRASQEEVDRYFERVYGWEMPEQFTPRRNIRPTEETNIVAHLSEGQVATVKANWWCQWDNAMEFEAKFPAFKCESICRGSLTSGDCKRGFVVLWHINIQEEIGRTVKFGDLVKLDIPSGDLR